MIVSIAHRRSLSCAVSVATLMVCVIGLTGCAGSMSDMGDSLTTAFADPAKYDYYDCKQLEGERKSIAAKIEELQRLMSKADTGVAGPVVAELAYRNDYIAYRGQARFANEAWRRNKCQETPPGAPGAATVAATSAPPSKGKGARSPSRSDSAVY